MQSVIDGTRSQIGDTVGALGHKADVKGRMAESVSKNPVRMVIGGAAVALLAGLMIPSTRMEDEQIGDIAEQMKDTAKETGSEALQRSKQVAQDVATAASDSASEQSHELTETLQDNVKQPGPVACRQLREIVQNRTGSSASSPSTRSAPSRPSDAVTPLERRP